MQRPRSVRSLPVGALLLAWLAGVWACDAVIGVNPCNKLCNSAEECGSGYQCVDGRCGGDSCGVFPADAGNGSSGMVGSSSGVSGGSSLTGSSGTSASSRASGSSSRASSSGNSGSAMTSGGSSSNPSSSAPVDAGVPDAGPPRCGVDGGPPVGTVCGVNQFCNANGNCQLGCFIAGVVQPAGPDSTNVCRRCAPATNNRDWVNTPDNTPCMAGGSNVCSAFLCMAGQCMEGARCSGTTPSCEPDGGACLCATAPTDSCATGVTNKACQVDGTCGCTVDGDCVAGQRCGANNRCQACNTSTACGNDCLACDTLPMSGGEAIWFACSGNTAPASSACLALPCDANRANCDGDDSNRCEANLETSATNCSACGVTCPSGSCVGGACTCNPDSCPLTQDCADNRCGCTQDSQCAQDAGYACVDAGCVRR